MQISVLKGEKIRCIFYTSNDCILDDFRPSADAFECRPMTVDEFIPFYRWKKDVMELLIKRSVGALSNKYEKTI